MKRIWHLCAAVAVATVMLPAPVQAGGSIGVGATCDPVYPQFCVATEATAEGAGTTFTDPPGYVAAVCKVETTGALLTSSTCSVEGGSMTTSLPGPNSASAVVRPTAKLTGHQVCWVSTGYFTNPLGGTVVVTDDDCAVLTV